MLPEAKVYHLKTILLTLFIVCSVLDVVQGADDYPKYYLEEDCPTGVLTVSLGETGTNSTAIVAATKRASYSIAMDCRVSLEAPTADYRIVTAVRQIEFRRPNFDGSCKDYIKIDTPMCSSLYRPGEEIYFFSNGNQKELLYHVTKEGIDNHTLTGYLGFELIITAQKGGSHCKSNEDWFQCENKYCIWSELKCDTHNNCGDLSDEQNCGTPQVSSNATVLIILGVLILLLLFIMCVATLLCSKNESVRRFSNRLRSRTLSYFQAPKISRGT